MGGEGEGEKEGGERDSPRSALAGVAGIKAEA